MAWSAPVILAAVAVPAYASSLPSGTCPTLTLTSWTTTTSGSFASASGNQGWMADATQGDRFASVTDNASRTNTATVLTTAAFDAVAGTTYTITIPVWSQYGNPRDQASGQQLEVLIDDKVVYLGGTRNALGIHNYTNRQFLSFSYVATTTKSVTIAYRFTLWDLADNGAYVTNDDIFVGLPSFVCS